MPAVFQYRQRQVSLRDVRRLEKPLKTLTSDSCTGWVWGLLQLYWVGLSGSQGPLAPVRDGWPRLQAISAVVVMQFLFEV